MVIDVQTLCLKNPDWLINIDLLLIQLADFSAEELRLLSPP